MLLLMPISTLIFGISVTSKTLYAILRKFSEGQSKCFATAVVLPLVLLLLLSSWLLIKPVWIILPRMRSLKHSKINLLHLALQVERTPLSKNHIASHAD